MPAANNLAVMLESLPEQGGSPAEIVQLYTSAAAKGIGEAESNLAGLYETGFGVSKNQTEAMNLYLQRCAVLRALRTDPTAILQRVRPEMHSLTSHMALSCLASLIAIGPIEMHSPKPINADKSTSVYKSSPSGRKTGYGDNWHFIIPGRDLQETTCSRCRFFVHVECASSMSDLAIYCQLGLGQDYFHVADQPGVIHKSYGAS